MTVDHLTTLLNCFKGTMPTPVSGTNEVLVQLMVAGLVLRDERTGEYRTTTLGNEVVSGIVFTLTRMRILGI